MNDPGGPALTGPVSPSRPPWLTVGQARAWYAAATGPLPAEPGLAELTVSEDQVPAGPPVRLYRPPRGRPGPVIVYAHGGGFVMGDLDTHDVACRRLSAAAGAVVVSAGYRRAPEHRFPAAHDDVAVATRWAAGRREKLAGPRSRLVIAGESAGASLAAGAALSAPDAARADTLLMIYPLLTPVLRTSEPADPHAFSRGELPWYWRHYLGPGRPPADPRLQPGSALPWPVRQVIMVLAGHDPLRNEQERLAAAITSRGGACTVLRFPAAAHGFFRLASATAARPAALAIADAL
jgi:acetyl esterase